MSSSSTSSKRTSWPAGSTVSSEQKNSKQKPLDLDSIITRFAQHIHHDPRALYEQGIQILTEEEVIQLLAQVRDVFKRQPMLVEIDPPVKIVGDIRGQFVDLLRHFDHSGWPPTSRYLFLGDYVDRGPQGVETFCLLAALKCRYPEDLWMLRGNHESERVNKVHGFYGEVSEKYGAEKNKVWPLFAETFNYMPVAGLVGKKIFGVHGGISPELKNFDQIRSLSRPRDIPDYGLMSDLLWSDPDLGHHGWAENTRGISYTFGEDVARKFCKDMKIAMIVRGYQSSHMIRHRGYQFFAGNRLLTILSAPNYCRGAYNDAAVLSVDENLGCRFDILRPDPSIEATYEHLPNAKK